MYAGSGNDQEADGSDEEEDVGGEPLLAIEKRARILDKKRCCFLVSILRCFCVMS